jgi:predicted XRE-type DNA-binding protein
MEGRSRRVARAQRDDAVVEQSTFENLRVRSLLMARLRHLMAVHRLTPVQAARWFNVSQSCVSHLVRGRVNRFSADSLINMLAHTGSRVAIRFEERNNGTDDALRSSRQWPSA